MAPQRRLLGLGRALLVWALAVGTAIAVAARLFMTRRAPYLEWPAKIWSVRDSLLFWCALSFALIGLWYLICWGLARLRLGEDSAVDVPARGGGGGRGWSVRLSLLLLLVSVFGLTLVELVSHRYFLLTGSLLQPSLVPDEASFGNSLRELLPVVASGISVGFVVQVGLLLLLQVVSPFWLLSRQGFGSLPLERNRALAGIAFFGVASLLLIATRLELPNVPERLRAPTMERLLFGERVEYARCHDCASTRREQLSRLEVTWSQRAQPGEVQPLSDVAPADRPALNVVVVVLESTGYFATEFFSSEMGTTPFLSDLASKSDVFHEVRAVVPHTSKSLVNILCGVEPLMGSLIAESWSGHLPGPCLPELLSGLGYRNGFLQAATRFFERRMALAEELGFDHFVSADQLDTSEFERTNYFGWDDRILLEPLVEWLQADTAPTFTVLLTAGAHHDYRSLEEDQDLEFSDYLSDRTARGRLKEERKSYLRLVHSQDRFSKAVLDTYRSLGLEQNTLFVFLGDHGEAFFEHGRGQHDLVVWEEGLRVPLMIYSPSTSAEPRDFHAPSSLSSLMPSLLERLSIDVVRGSQGLQRPLESGLGDSIFVASCFYEDQCAAAVGNGLKLVHLYAEAPEQLYDLEADPLERSPLAKDDPRWRDAERLREELHRRLAQSPHLYGLERVTN